MLYGLYNKTLRSPVTFSGAYGRTCHNPDSTGARRSDAGVRRHALRAAAQVRMSARPPRLRLLLVAVGAGTTLIVGHTLNTCCTPNTSVARRTREAVYRGPPSGQTLQLLGDGEHHGVGLVGGVRRIHVAVQLPVIIPRRFCSRTYFNFAWSAFRSSKLINTFCFPTSEGICGVYSP